eukprot:scaffold65992_cov75-Phaeocystis_antarctica.AAC.2
MLVAWNSAETVSSCCATTNAASGPSRALYSSYALAITAEALALRRPEVSSRLSSAMTDAAEEPSSGTIARTTPAAKAAPARGEAGLDQRRHAIEETDQEGCGGKARLRRVQVLHAGAESSVKKSGGGVPYV